MIGNILKDLRKSKGITQIEFAKIFNIATGTIGNWETGKREPDYETLCKIANYFNVSVDYILGREEQKEKPADHGKLSEEDKYYIEKIKNLSEKNKRLVLEIIENLESQ